MHGLINASVQGFVLRTYGPETWDRVVSSAGLRERRYEALLTYADTETQKILSGVERVLDRSREEVLEDIGNYLVTTPELEAVRRLLRFGGETFTDFLLSLNELHDRGRLALPDLSLPHIEVEEGEIGTYVLRTWWPYIGAGPLLLGLLKAMADDYGALALLDMRPSEHARNGISQVIHVKVVQQDFASGRAFELADGGHIA